MVIRELKKVIKALTESFLPEREEFYIDFKDVPEWVSKILIKDHQMRPKSVRVIPDANPQVGGTWHDANRTTLYAYDGEGEIEEISGTYGGMNPWATRTENAVNSGFKTVLKNINQMILQVSSYPKSAKLYVHPDAVPKMLPSGENDLTPIEILCLIITKSKIPSYRFEEANRIYDRKISFAVWDGAKKSLIQKGLLNKAGAITTQGKNAVTSYRDERDVKDKFPDLGGLIS